MKAAIRRMLAKTVFNPLPGRAADDQVIAVMFHRTAACVYLLYSVWGAATLVDIIPSMREENGVAYQDLFSLTVAIVGIIAASAATLYPRFARLELYASAAVVSLIGLYLVVLASTVTEPGRLGAMVIVCSYLVVPGARSAYIYRRLVRQSEQEKQ